MKTTNLASKTLKTNNNKVARSDKKINKTVKNLSQSKKVKNNKSKTLTRIKAIGFLTSKVKETFT